MAVHQIPPQSLKKNAAGTCSQIPSPTLNRLKVDMGICYKRREDLLT